MDDDAPSRRAGAGQPELLPDWLLGGAGRRRILERLVEDGGWTGRALEEELDLGHAWVFEVLRVLLQAEAIERVPDTRGRYRLAKTGLGKSLRSTLKALEPFAATPVSRPPSRRRGRS
ncbi:hypothetical protein [Baekduia sp. Peel2402]|uniref:hypothetical protein n=1 Tax=Baekduia sp. Peel2402 TaxID=3458296 RepID=UPI00403EC4E2